MGILKKMTIILMIAVMCVSFVGVNVYADGDGEDWKSVTQFDSNNDTALDGKARDIVGAIISVVRIVAVGVAIIMLAFVAMKYMTAAPGDRADIKKHAVVYVVGAVVLFGSAGIIGIIQDFATNI